MRSPLIAPLLAVALVLSLSATDASASDPFDLPLLPVGQHATLWRQWVPVSPPAQVQLALEYDRAIERGMGVGLFHNGWAALEPAPGIYNADLLLSGLEELADDGLLPMVTVSAVDIADLDVPRDLLDPDDPDQLRDGLRLDDPLILARHAAFLDWLVPHLVEYGSFALAVGVEVDVRCDSEHPEEAEETVNFLIAARDHVRTLAPDLAVAMTLTVEAVNTDRPCGRGVLAESDFGSFTYYHVNPIFYFPLPLAEIATNFDELVASVPGRQVIIQELGCPAGFETRPSQIGSSPGLQRLCYRTFFEEIRRRPEIRVATPFIQADFQEAYMTTVARNIFEGLPPIFAKAFAEGWSTMGLCRTDGTCKPAWQEFLDALEAFD